MDNIDSNKYLNDSQMTFQEVFNFAYEDLVPVLRYLEREIGRDIFRRALVQAVYDTAFKSGQDAARRLHGLSQAGDDIVREHPQVVTIPFNPIDHAVWELSQRQGK